MKKVLVIKIPCNINMSRESLLHLAETFSISIDEYGLIVLPEYVECEEHEIGDTTLMKIEIDGGESVYVTPAILAKYFKTSKSKQKTVQELAEEVIKGYWGNGYKREKLLENAGYDYKAVQDEVNRIYRIAKYIK